MTRKGIRTSLFGAIVKVTMQCPLSDEKNHPELHAQRLDFRKSATSRCWARYWEVGKVVSDVWIDGGPKVLVQFGDNQVEDLCVSHLTVIAEATP